MVRVLRWLVLTGVELTLARRVSDLALQEYSSLVHSLDPSAVPPSIPRVASSSNILLSTPELSTSASSPRPDSPSSPSPQNASDSISNLLIGQRGVHQLFHDFTNILTEKEKSIHDAQASIQGLEITLNTIRDQLTAETALRVAAQEDRTKVMRDDASAAKVVERYMTFTQKTHATVHMHLDNLRTRSSATQGTLRKEVSSLRDQLRMEAERSQRLRLAIDEMSEGFAREVAGRRREVALRLSMLAVEEQRERRVEIWLDKVRQMREGAEGAVLEPDVIETLLDEGLDAVSSGTSMKDKRPGNKRSWTGLLGRKRVDSPTPRAKITDPADEQSSMARILLAESLANSLQEDLRKETDLRVDLERQRVEWLAQDALEGTNPSHPNGHGEHETLLFFDASGDYEKESDDVVVDRLVDEAEDKQAGPNGALDVPSSTGLRTPSPLPDRSPALAQLQETFEALKAQYQPLQTTLHDLSSSLANLKIAADGSALSQPPTSPIGKRFPPSNGGPSHSPRSGKRASMLNLSRRPTGKFDPVFTNLLDSLHEVIEDARVDVEIALADEDRVFRGFEALLGVGKSGAVQGREVMKDVREYVADREAKDILGRLEKRVGDIESDLMSLKTTLHQIEGMGLDLAQDHRTDEKPARKSVWEGLELLTITPLTPRLFPSSPLSYLGDKDSPVEMDPRARTTSLFSSMGSVGRSFSASVIGAPRRVGSMTTGLYRGPSSKGQDDQPNGENADEDVPLASHLDDVE